MPDFSYVCTKATVRNELELAAPSTANRVLLCDLEFEDEHGHALAPVQNAIVVVGDEWADVERYPENLLREDARDEEWKLVEALCQNSPTYNVYNGKELAAMLPKGWTHV